MAGPSDGSCCPVRDAVNECEASKQKIRSCPVLRKMTPFLVPGSELPACLPRCAASHVVLYSMGWQQGLRCFRTDLLTENYLWEVAQWEDAEGNMRKTRAAMYQPSKVDVNLGPGPSLQLLEVEG